MRYRPSRLFILCMATLGLTGAAGGWAWQKANAAPNHLRNSSSFLELLRYREKPDFQIPTPEEIARTKQAVLAMKAQLDAEFPILKIAEKPVPAELNGFLQLHLLQEPYSHQGPPLSQELRDLLNGQTEWDPVLLRSCLEEHAELVASLEHVASLPSRSSSGMPDSYHGFISARTAKLAADVLMAKARLAAEAGDEEETLRWVAASQNLASHLREIETPNLLCETVVILVDLSVQNTILTHLLPAIGPGADLPRWSEAMRVRSYSAPDFARVMRGEWSTAAEFFLLPVLVNKDHPDRPRDGGELARAMAGNMADVVLRLSDATLTDLLDFKDLPASSQFPKLSGKSREIMDLFYVGSHAWSRGYLRGSSIFARNQAVIELLIRERDGAVLSDELASTLTRDPLSGRPFEIDAEARIISFHQEIEALQFDPIALPW